MDSGQERVGPNVPATATPGGSETETQVQFPSKVPPPAPPAEQEFTAWGPFEKMALIGRGGFGSVYRAWDPRLQRDVALKLLRPKAEAAGQGMLLEEARMMARVRHANVVPVYGVEAHGGRIGFWSEFIEGRTLAAIVAEQGPMGARECAVAGAEICRALGAVHAAGLLHQDIKAENVMREQGGRILLMDFGLSRLSGHGLTGTGTPVYMAPELWLGAPASVATDIYATGVLLYHLTTGKFPFDGRTTAELRDAVANGKRLALLDARPDLPAALARIIERACHPEAGNRPHSAGLLGIELSESLEPPRTREVSRRWWIAGGASTAAGASFLGWRVWRERSAAPEEAQAPEKFIEAQRLIARFDQPGHLDRAIQLLNETVESDSNFALAYSLRAQANAMRFVTASKKEFLDAALADANRALALNKTLSPVYVTLGILHLRTGKRDLATEELQRALALDATNAAAHRVMGALLGQQGRAQDARDSLQRAIDLDPDDWQGYYALGNFVQRGGDNDGALKLFKQALERAPGNPLVLNNLGFTYLQKEDFPKAIETLRSAVAIAPRYLGYSNLCGALMLEGRYEEAAQSCHKAVELEPNQYGAWGDLAGAYRWSPGGKEKAAEYYRKAITLAEDARKLNPKDARLLVFLGAYLATSGETSRFLDYIRQAEALAPNDIEVLFRAGEALEMAGRREEAISRIAKAIRRGYSRTYLERSPDLSGLRSDPRFQKLQER